MGNNILKLRLNNDYTVDRVYACKKGRMFIIPEFIILTDKKGVLVKAPNIGSCILEKNKYRSEADFDLTGCPVKRSSYDFSAEKPYLIKEDCKKKDAYSLVISADAVNASPCESFFKFDYMEEVPGYIVNNAYYCRDICFYIGNIQKIPFLDDINRDAEECLQKLADVGFRKTASKSIVRDLSLRLVMYNKRYEKTYRLLKYYLSSCDVEKLMQPAPCEPFYIKDLNDGSRDPYHGYEIMKSKYDTSFDKRMIFDTLIEAHLRLLEMCKEQEINN